MSTTGKILGASTAIAGGIAVLPQTSGMFSASFVAVIAIGTAAIVLGCTLAAVLYKKFSK